MGGYLRGSRPIYSPVPMSHRHMQQGTCLHWWILSLDKNAIYADTLSAVSAPTILATYASSSSTNCSTHSFI